MGVGAGPEGGLLLDKESWEADMVEQCESKLSVRPERGASGVSLCAARTLKPRGITSGPPYRCGQST